MAAGEATVRDIWEAMTAAENDLAYTTVLSLLQVMEQKGTGRPQAASARRTPISPVSAASRPSANWPAASSNGCLTAPSMSTWSTSSIRDKRGEEELARLEAMIAQLANGRDRPQRRGPSHERLDRISWVVAGRFLPRRHVAPRSRSGNFRPCEGAGLRMAAAWGIVPGLLLVACFCLSASRPHSREPSRTNRGKPVSAPCVRCNYGAAYGLPEGVLSARTNARGEFRDRRCWRQRGVVSSNTRIMHAEPWTAFRLSIRRRSSSSLRGGVVEGQVPSTPSPASRFGGLSVHTLGH